MSGRAPHPPYPPGPPPSQAHTEYFSSLITSLGCPAGLGMLGFLVSVPWMLSTPPRPDTLGRRRALFGAAALSQGLLLAPIVRASLALHPGVLFTAFAGTAGAFAGWTGQAWGRGPLMCHHAAPSHCRVPPRCFL